MDHKNNLTLIILVGYETLELNNKRPGKCFDNKGWSGIGPIEEASLRYLSLDLE